MRATLLQSIMEACIQTSTTTAGTAEIVADGIKKTTIGAGKASMAIGIGAITIDGSGTAGIIITTATMIKRNVCVPIALGRRPAATLERLVLSNSTQRTGDLARSPSWRIVMKYLLFAVALGLASLVSSPPTYSFEGEGAYDQFLENHPGIKHDLERNPKLVNDPDYLEAHPQFKQFYRNHGEVRGELRENPNGIMQREDYDLAHPRQERRDEERWRTGVVRERQHDRNR